MSLKLDLPPTFTPVEVGAIEDDLAARWHTATRDGAAPAAHSSTLNLIVCVEDAAAAGEVSKVVDRLAATHPIRSLTIVSDELADDRRVAAWLGAGCAPAPAAQICSEEITLLVNPDALELNVSTVEGLLAGDLPAYFYWRGAAPTGDPLFAGLARLADKVIVDSVRFGDGPAALDTVRRLLNHRSYRFGVADLNWERTAPWREAVAACFDDPSVLALLPSLDRASVDFAGGSSPAQRPSARALLVAGWLASREARLRNRIRVRATALQELGSGRVVQVSLSSSQTMAQLALERRSSPTGIGATARDASGHTIRMWSFPASTLGEAELIHRCIDAPARDPLLEAALHHE